MLCDSSRKKMIFVVFACLFAGIGAMEAIPAIDPKIVVKKYTNPPKIFGMNPKQNPSGPLPLPVRPPNEMFPSSPDFARAFEMFPSDPPMAPPSRVDDSSNNRPFQKSSIKGRQPPPRWLHTAVTSRTGPENKQEMIVYGGVATDPGTLNDLWVYSVTQDTWSKLERSSGPEMPMYPNPGDDQTDKQQIEIMGRPPVVRPAPVMNGFPGGPDRTQQYTNMKSRYDSFSIDSVQKGLPIIMPGQPPAIEPQFPAHEKMSFLETNERVRLRGPRYGEGTIDGAADYSKIRTMMTAARSEIWIYDINTREWREPMKKAGEEPAARWMHSAVLNNEEKEMIVFGGCSNSFEVLRDVWVYKIEANTWTLEWPKKGATIDEAKSPKAREGHAAAMLKGNKMIVYGGITQNYEVLNDVWTYASKAWTEIKIGEKDPAPPARWLHSMIPFGNDRTIVYGGCSETSGPLGDTWELDTKKKKWTQLGSQRHYPAPARYLHSAMGMTTGDEAKFTMVVRAFCCDVRCYFQRKSHTHTHKHYRYTEDL